jgi:leader peptidase (prepilin peptidase) / N-methyltransferase
MISLFPNITNVYGQFFMVAVFGLALGSFLNVVICRLPQGWKIFFSSAFSRCPFCGTAIHWYDNIPVFSFLLLRGRCRDCGVRISVQYPLMELAMAMAAVFLFRRFGPSPYFFSYLCFFFILLAIAVVDFRRMEIPDSLIVIGMVCGIGFSLITPFPGWTNAMAGLVFGTTIPLILVTSYEALRKSMVMGGGDIKLIGMIGAFLGWQPLGAILFYSALIGMVAALGLKVIGKSGRIPFAPFLFLGTLCTLTGPDFFSY